MSDGDASRFEERHIKKNQWNIRRCLESVNNKLAGCCGDTPLSCNFENCLIGTDQGRTAILSGTNVMTQITDLAGF